MLTVPPARTPAIAPTFSVLTRDCETRADVMLPNLTLVQPMERDSDRRAGGTATLGALAAGEQFVYAGRRLRVVFRLTSGLAP